jgi:hypothetical protein
MRRLPVYVEIGVAMAADCAAAAWAFEPDMWGRCGQGHNEESAVRALCHDACTGTSTGIDPIVVERITGDEQAFARDLQPAGDVEREVTLAILAAVRAETLALVTASSPAVLDFDDPARTLPAWARWRTLRQMAWHLADTESRYYLPSLGLPARPAQPDLITELTASARHVHAAVSTMPAALVRRTPTAVWTTTKVLRRLAWHERSELITMRHLAHHARAAIHDGHR